MTINLLPTRLVRCALSLKARWRRLCSIAMATRRWLGGGRRRLAGDVRRWERLRLGDLRVVGARLCLRAASAPAPAQPTHPVAFTSGALDLLKAKPKLKNSRESNEKQA